MAAERPPITCHVLDTSVGKPGHNIPVSLILEQPTSGSSQAERPSFTGKTNVDGRVTQWAATSGGQELQAFMESSDGKIRWRMVFETEEYWQAKNIDPFFPKTEIIFQTTGFKGLAAGTSQPHWHVPLLMGPYNYTTYRGS
jgi:5-hydroxyisourate hydrolase